MGIFNSEVNSIKLECLDIPGRLRSGTSFYVAFTRNNFSLNRYQQKPMHAQKNNPSFAASCQKNEYGRHLWNRVGEQSGELARSAEEAEMFHELCDGVPSLLHARGLICKNTVKERLFYNAFFFVVTFRTHKMVVDLSLFEVSLIDNNIR